MGISHGWIRPQSLVHFPTTVLVGPETLQIPGIVDRSSQVGATSSAIHSPNNPTGIVVRAVFEFINFSPPGNYAGKWETTNCFKSRGYICEMTGGQNMKPTPAPGLLSLFTH